jgi:hypothetical protein
MNRATRDRAATDLRAIGRPRAYLPGLAAFPGWR